MDPRHHAPSPSATPAAQLPSHSLHILVCSVREWRNFVRFASCDNSMSFMLNGNFSACNLLGLALRERERERKRLRASERVPERVDGSTCDSPTPHTPRPAVPCPCLLICRRRCVCVIPLTWRAWLPYFCVI